jgi:hypothetical protein
MYDGQHLSTVYQFHDDHIIMANPFMVVRERLMKNNIHNAANNNFYRKTRQKLRRTTLIKYIILYQSNV